MSDLMKKAEEVASNSGQMTNDGSGANASGGGGQDASNAGVGGVGGTKDTVMNSELNKGLSAAGMPEGADSTIDKEVDKEV